MKKILTILLFVLVFFFAGVAKIKLADAALLPSIGWLWGGSEDSTMVGKVSGSIDGNESGVGWISLNSDNAGAGGGDYSVNIPDGNGTVTGYAWNSNLQSYIDFAPRAGCPTEKYAGSCDPYPAGAGVGQATDVMRVGNTLKGWARVVNIAAAKKINNSGGEDGWISMDPAVSGFGVNILSGGVMSGYAWAGNVLGAIDFSKGDAEPGPNVIISAYPYVLLEPGEILPPTTKKTTISWDITTLNTLSSCTRNCYKGATMTEASCLNWKNNTSTALSGSVTDVDVSDPSVRFYMECTDQQNFVGRDDETINYGCKPSVCSATQTCDKNAGSFTATTNGNTAACMVGCTTDSDCALREGTVWREVAPN